MSFNHRGDTVFEVMARTRKPVRACRNDPRFVSLLRLGLVRALPVRGSVHMAVFELSEAGRRKAHGYRARGAGL